MHKIKLNFTVQNSTKDHINFIKQTHVIKTLIFENVKTTVLTQFHACTGLLVIMLEKCMNLIFTQLLSGNIYDRSVI